MFYKKEKVKFNIKFEYVLLLISILLSTYGVLRSEVAIYTLKKNPDLTPGETPEKVCFYGLNSIISGSALSTYFSPELFEYLKDNPTILNLSSEDKIIDLFYRDDNCLLVVKNEEIMRGFVLPLEKSMSFSLFYRIKTIKEEDVSNILTTISKSKKD